MKIIAHRANFGGPKKKNENQLSSIETCIGMGYDVEIDIRYLDGKFFLGHDKPETIITKDELKIIKNKAWIHCKNLKAFSFFKHIDEDFNYFWHENDSYTLTSKRYIWTYPGKELSPECICVMPELNYPLDILKSLKNKNIIGICTDYPNLFD